MAITMVEIAKEAGVSISTVSRVINGTKAVSPEVHKKVYDIIEKYNYKPNELARGLVMKQTNMIGVIVPDISNEVFGALTKGIASVCEAKGYTIIVSQSDSLKEKELHLLGVMEDKKLDGVLFAGVNVNQELVSAMQKKEYPVVLVAQEASAGDGLLDTVVPDNENAVYDAVKFLVDNGHRKIALIGGPEHDYSSGGKREKGYVKAVEAFECYSSPSYIERGDFSLASGYDAMRRIYEENRELPTAVLACSDHMAIGAVQWLRHMQINVPEDISVMGFDDMAVSAYMMPELSTVRIPYYEEGVKAAEELIRLIGSAECCSKPQTHYIPHKIIRRSSTKKLE